MCVICLFVSPLSFPLLSFHLYSAYISDFSCTCMSVCGDPTATMYVQCTCLCISYTCQQSPKSMHEWPSKCGRHCTPLDPDLKHCGQAVRTYMCKYA